MNTNCQLLTHSRMACAKSCLRRHFYAYEMGLRPIRETPPLRMGASIHRGIEVFQTCDSQTFEASVLSAIRAATLAYEQIPAGVVDQTDWAVERVTVERLLHAYLTYYQADGLNVIASERAFDLPLVNPQTGKESRIYRLAGKIDRIVQLPDGRLAVLETKTTGVSIDDASDYWARLRLDSQISLYVYAARQLGFDVATVLYDVIRKPEIGLHRATPQEKRKYTKEGRLYANQRERDETPEEFAERLSEDIAIRPEFYFGRREIPRLEADITEAQAEWWQQGKLLRDCQNSGRWFRNTNACLQPFRCTYAEICFAGADPTVSLPTNFKLVENVHPELIQEERRVS
jgi:RecB family exonuclease